MRKKLITLFVLVVTSLQAQVDNKSEISKEVVRVLDSIKNAKEIEEKSKPKKEHWYDNIGIRGYFQIRYNGLLSTNDKVSCDQCDKSWGTTSTAPDAKSNDGFFLRRGRIIIFGQVHPNVYIYIQPDFASSPGSGLNGFGQLRDAYFDLSIDKKREYRFRVGQSKVPYGYENMQSSQNRLSLDRNDAFNSAVPNERELGVFFYWAPSKIRDRFAMLIKDGYKGSGDYGVFALGGYNGQGPNKNEGNKNLHVVSRISYPFAIGNQIIEPGVQAYMGKYAFTGELSKDIPTKNTNQSKDQRAAASFIVYPKPFGLQTEYTIGRGPRYDKVTNSVQESHLEGGYVTLNYKWDLPNKHILYPFAKFQYYNGGKKFEKDARSYIVRDYEFGLEWQPIKNFELVAQYVISDRTFEDSALKNNRQKGNLLRLQAQFNF
jgi:hypothetical protein